jgi:hypothetical protein
MGSLGRHKIIKMIKHDFIPPPPPQGKLAMCLSHPTNIITLTNENQELDKTYIIGKDKKQTICEKIGELHKYFMIWDPKLIPPPSQQKNWWCHWMYLQILHASRKKDIKVLF